MYDISKAKFISGYEGLYCIDVYGNVYSLLKKDILKMKLSSDKDGYKFLRLYKNGKGKSLRAHRLVAQTFIPNIEKKPVVNHINGIKDDNRIDNLEWMTVSENNFHAYKTGLKIITNNSNFYNNHPTLGKKGELNHLSKKVIQMDLLGNVIKEWGSTMDIERELSIKNTNISACCLNKRKTTGGYTWKYL